MNIRLPNRPLVATWLSPRRRTALYVLALLCWIGALALPAVDVTRSTPLTTGGWDPGDAPEVARGMTLLLWGAMLLPFHPQAMFGWLANPLFIFSVVLTPLCRTCQCRTRLSFFLWPAVLLAAISVPLYNASPMLGDEGGVTYNVITALHIGYALWLAAPLLLLAALALRNLVEPIQPK
ncbi:MAG: hypothetical protein U7M05_01205 [Candidatus Igneacidithiobacillus chanchocoensis]